MHQEVCYPFHGSDILGQITSQALTGQCLGCATDQEVCYPFHGSDNLGGDVKSCSEELAPPPPHGSRLLLLLLLFPPRPHPLPPPPPARCLLPCWGGGWGAGGPPPIPLCRVVPQDGRVGVAQEGEGRKMLGRTLWNHVHNYEMCCRQGILLSNILQTGHIALQRKCQRQICATRQSQRQR
jgi:hypothetical protein